MRDSNIALDAPVRPGPGAGEAGSRRAVFGWVMFDWACQPFFTLITTFIFAPYFASAVAPDPATGQAWWAFATAGAGVVMALLSPALGAISDATGAKKAWTIVFGAVGALSCLAMWPAAPDSGTAAILLALGGYALALIAFELAAVFNNAMMPSLVPPERIGRLSGAGWAAGYAGGLVSLALVLAFFAADPGSGRTLIGLPPALGLDAGAREGDRAAGPLSTLWFFLFIIPFILFTRDAPSTGKPVAGAVREGLSRLRGTFAEARRQPQILRFLIGHMIYQDGLVALFALGGIYGAGVFGWTSVELGLFGITILVTGIAGALVGGCLDDRLGPRAVVIGSLVLLMLVSLGVLSLGREHIFFVIATAPATGTGGLYESLPEKVFFGLGILIGIVAGPLQAASRSLLVRVAPPGEAGRYFGLLALSGKMTSFAGPLLIGIATAATGSQAAGPAVLLVLFAAGLLSLRGVR